MGARLGGSFDQRLLHAHEAGQVGQPLWDPELALDRGIDPAVHPALDRLIDSAREVSPAAEADRDLIGEVPAVPAIEEVADGLMAATRALRDPGYSKRPRLIGLGVLPNTAVEAPGFVLARHRCGYPVLHRRPPCSGDRMHALPGPEVKSNCEQFHEVGAAALPQSGA